ncbi:MAG: delta-60 repeat domain-containing protein, partial [Anaerolineae bacterium]|nr:delta-60 repeat domain-containing protein [Anaerolineae bacterium]
TRDISFNNPNITGAGNIVDALVLQSDGKLLVGGNFLYVGSTSRDRLARLQNTLPTCTSVATGDWSNNATWDCGRPPSTEENAVIASSHTVTLDVDSADLANVTINSGGTLTNNGTARTLSLTGNWSNSGTFTPGTSIGVTFKGTGAQTLTGATTFYNLTINNTGGSVTLANNMTVNGALTLTSDLTTASNVLILGSSASVSGAGDVVGTVRRTSFSGTQQYNNQYTTINFTTAPTQMDVKLTKSAPSGLTTAVNRYYTLTPTGAVNATIQLAYKDSELNGVTEANARLWRYDTGQSKWILQGGTVNTTNNHVSLAGVTQFSDWAISDNGAPTAVTLSSFRAQSSTFDLAAWFAEILRQWGR